MLGLARSVVIATPLAMSAAVVLFHLLAPSALAPRDSLEAHEYSEFIADVAKVIEASRLSHSRVSLTRWVEGQVRPWFDDDAWLSLGAVLTGWLILAGVTLGWASSRWSNTWGTVVISQALLYGSAPVLFCGFRPWVSFDVLPAASLGLLAVGAFARRAFIWSGLTFGLLIAWIPTAWVLLPGLLVATFTVAVQRKQWVSLWAPSTVALVVTLQPVHGPATDSIRVLEWSALVPTVGDAALVPVFVLWTVGPAGMVFLWHLWTRRSASIHLSQTPWSDAARSAWVATGLVSIPSVIGWTEPGTLAPLVFPSLWLWPFAGYWLRHGIRREVAMFPGLRSPWARLVGVVVGFLGVWATFSSTAGTFEFFRDAHAVGYRGYSAGLVGVMFGFLGWLLAGRWFDGDRLVEPLVGLVEPDLSLAEPKT